MLAVVVFAITLGIIAASLPDPSARRNPLPLSGDDWSFDYRPVEALVTRLAPHFSDRPGLNHDTLNQLDGIAAALPAALSEADIERIGFLSRQGLPAPVADDLADTLTAFLRYRHDFRTSPKTARARFERAVALQNRYFGATRAGQLFGQQRRLQRYLIERQAIHANSDLSAAQRQEALNRASQEFRPGSGAGRESAQ